MSDHPTFTAGSVLPAEFSIVLPADECLHAPLDHHGYRATETFYYGFSIPERNLNAEIYIWCHPVLGVASAGVFAWTGFKPETLAAEYFNYEAYLPCPKPDSGLDVVLGHLRITVTEPLEQAVIRYSGDGDGFGFEVTFDALHAPVGRPGGGHFTQPMKTSGWLRLGGEDLPVAGTFSRDRSWGEERPEDRRDLPPLTWMAGVLDGDLAFHVAAFDDPDQTSFAPGACSVIPAAGRARWGYVIDNGQTLRVTDCAKFVRRDTDGVSPLSFTLDIEVEGGRQFRIDGDVTGRLPMQWWPNMNTHMCFVRWRCGSASGWGDAQDIQYNPFVFASRQAADRRGT
jgi:hypothetical protein